MGLKGYWGGARIPISLRAPRGKLIQIGSDVVEVWPNRCVNGHHCVQCYFNGKIRCAPRWWFYPPVYLAPNPTKETSCHKPCVNLDMPVGERGDTLADLLPAQPLIPLNDGGFTSDITNAVIARGVLTKPYAPSRVTDQACNKCGYLYLRFECFDKRQYKNLYKCPQCGGSQLQDSRRRPNILRQAIELSIRELWVQGFIKSEIIIRIERQHGVRVGEAGLRKAVRRMGLTPRPRSYRQPRELPRLGLYLPA